MPGLTLLQGMPLFHLWQECSGKKNASLVLESLSVTPESISQWILSQELGGYGLNPDYACPAKV